MTPEKLQVAINEAERFLQKAYEAKLHYSETSIDYYGDPCHGKRFPKTLENTVRRQIRDLIAALTDL